MTLQVTKLEGVAALRSRFQHLPELVERAEVSALNKLGSQAETASNRAIRDVFAIKASDVKKNLKRIPARSASRGRGARFFTVITAKGGRFALHKFSGSPKEPVSQKGVPVKRRKGWPTARVLKTAGRSKVARDIKTGHAPFVSRMMSGHVGIFVRTDRWSDKGFIWRKQLHMRGRHQIIRELTYKSAAQMFDSTAKEKLNALLAEKGVQVFTHELQYYLSKQK